MMDMKAFEGAFLSEAEDLLQTLSDGLLALEKKPDNKKQAEVLMRAAHTLKSSSAAMGYGEMSSLTHSMEDVFEVARQGSRLTAEQIAGLFRDVDALEQILASIKQTGQEGKVEAEAVTHIKVPVNRLDHLLELMEEVLVARLRLMRFKTLSPDLADTVEEISRLVSDLQYRVMQMRLVPVAQIFSRFPRMIRDLAAAQKKEVDLQMSGEDLELDRSVVDKLAEPLGHLLRNAVDHGVGERGSVRLTAARERDVAIITVENDGRPIDWVKVAAAAAERGLISAKRTKALAAEEMQSLLFRGISTKKAVSETSGRGVGLAVVKEFVEQMGGQLTVISPLSAKGGTRFTLELPLTLAVIQALIVGVRQELFAIPFSNIERIVQVPNAAVKSMADQDVALVSGVDVPLAPLSKLFHLSAIASPTSRTVVMVRRGTEIAGLVVDRLVSEEEIVVKPLTSVLRQAKGFAGFTILGDGQAVPILDVASLLGDSRTLVRTYA